MSVVIKLYNDVAIMNELVFDTMGLIKATESIKPIKKLITIREIIDLNLYIQQNYKEYEGNPPWDIVSLHDLNSHRIELLVFHRIEFMPAVLLDKYNSKLCQLFRTIEMNNQKVNFKWESPIKV